MAKPDIDTDLIEMLAQLLAKSGLSEIEIEQDTTRIRVARQMVQATETHMIQASAPVPPVQVANAVSVPEPAANQDEQHPGAIKAPIVGTVYLSPDPTSPTFVRQGDSVEQGQTLLIIEAMKVMNAIRAPRKGRVAKIIVENESPVEFGEPLLILE